MKTKYFTLIFILFVCNKSFCFSFKFNNDSLQQSISKRIKDKDKTLTIKEIESAYKYYSKNKDIENTSLMLINFSRVYIPVNVDSALVYYKKGLIEINKAPNEVLRRNLYFLHNQINSKMPDSIPLLEQLKNQYPKNSLAAAFINEKIAGKYYESAPEKAIKYFKEAIEIYRVNNDKVCEGFANNNLAFTYQEGLSDNINALGSANKGLEIWKSIKDTTNEANMLKYKALLYGKLHRLDEALIAGNSAISKFSSKKDSMGINVTYFDLAIAFNEMNFNDSAAYYLNKANAFWKRKGAEQRIYGINNLLIEVYNKQSNKELAQKVIEDNLKLDSEKMYWKLKLDFYKNAQAFYQQNKLVSEADKFQEKYNQVELAHKTK